MLRLSAASEVTVAFGAEPHGGQGPPVHSKPLFFVSTGKHCDIGSVASGIGTVASGIGTVASGIGTIASDIETVACGIGTVACGIETVACGIGTVACGIETVTCGIETVACGIETVACGIGTVACGIGTADSDLLPPFPSFSTHFCTSSFFGVRSHRAPSPPVLFGGRRWRSRMRGE